jgi:hypothetical protein
MTTMPRRRARATIHILYNLIGTSTILSKKTIPRNWATWGFFLLTKVRKNGPNGSNLSNQVTRVAKWYIFKQKVPNWVNFGGSFNGRCWYIL